MAKVYRFYVGIVTALALCKYPMADQVTDSPANATASICLPHHAGDNCTDTDPWAGHFSECPENLADYCIHGVCRYLKEHRTAACRCDPGYEGDRCQYVQLPPPSPWTNMREAIITCLVVLLMAMVVAVMLICLSTHFKYRFCWQRRRRRREAPSNVTEKLSMTDTAAAETSPAGESTEMTHITTV